MKQIFEVDWCGGKVASRLLSTLLDEYLRKFGYPEALVWVIEKAPAPNEPSDAPDATSPRQGR
jgi:hypothetical protein